MTLIMPSLKRAKNGDYFSRKVIPSDIREEYLKLHGKSHEERFRVSSLVSPSSAKAQYAEWLAEIEFRIVQLRAVQAGDAVELSNKELHALAGQWYDWFVDQQSKQELSITNFAYERFQDALMLESGLENADDDHSKRSKFHADRVRATVIEVALLQSFIAEQGVKLSSVSHERLIDIIEHDLSPALAVSRRRALGDYSADTHRERFPVSDEQPVQSYAHSRVRPSKLAGWNVWEAFEAWVKERQPAQQTIGRWRGVFLNMNEFMKGKDVALITDDDAMEWKDSLINSGTISGQTINAVYLGSAKNIFKWIKGQKKISHNPFEGIRVAAKKITNSKTEFSDEDIKLILTAAMKPQSKRRAVHLSHAIRWVPWLCAYTGSRAGEMTQLRKQDIKRHVNGFWYLVITPEAGTVKTSQTRLIPLHNHLINQGFIDFVTNSKDGALFYDDKLPQLKDDDILNAKRAPYVITRQKLGDWVRKIGVTDKGISPNHGWRHTFKRVAARAGIEQRLRDGFTGHTADHVGAIYETPTLEDLAQAIKLFPEYKID